MRGRVPGHPLLVPILALGVVLGGTLCFGHGDAPPTPTTPGPPTADGYLIREKVYPPRWSWIHWWEANRDPYLKLLTQRTDLPTTDADAAKALRDKVVKALVAAATQAPAPVSRSAAILALGRMNETSAFAAISNLARTDREERVRRAALVALGLLDSTDTRDFLLTMNCPTDLLLEATSGGLGLLHRADDGKVLATLQQAVGGSKAGVATISAWGLKRRPDPANIKFLAGVLKTSKSPWLASEALLALGQQHDPDAIGLLADVLLATKAAAAIASWVALETHDREVQGIGGERIRVPVDEVEKIGAQYKKFSEWRNQGPNDAGSAGSVILRVGIEKVYIAELRASAAIALGDIQVPQSQKVLLAALALPDDKYTDLIKGFAIMSLARFGNEEILPPLLEHLAPRHKEGRHKTIPEMESPLRGFAALALGLYAHPKGVSLAGSDAPGFDKVCEILAERVAERDDTLEVRAACTLALGLTGRTECLKLLNRVRAGVQANEDLLAGYMILASAMIGDHNIVEPARRFLGPIPNDESTSQILGRRAAVLGLGLTENPEAVPVLTEAWNQSYYVNREVPVALALRGDHGAADALIKLLTTTVNPLEQAFASQCLGELFSQERPQRLAWFLNDANYTLRNVRMMPYETMANEFLCAYLIPCFGDQWQ